MNSAARNTPGTPLRAEARFAPYRDLSLLYEGHGEAIPVRVPDISPSGMFINTPDSFPEGSVLNLEFRLPTSPDWIKIRGEVRYCVPGVGVGVEFIEISAEHREAIREQILAARAVETPDSI
jgi:hypothetical protein